MSDGFEGNGQGAGTSVAETAPTESLPTESLVSSSVGDRCVNCGSVLSSDQRYCVVCGERRGAPRFTLPVGSGAGEPPTASTAAPSSGSRGPRFGSGATLIAGVGTLLLALLVGFLIGNAASNNNTKTVAGKSPTVKLINVGGSSSGSTGSAGTSTAGSSNTSTTGSSGSHKSSKKASTKAKNTAKAQSSAASKVTGGNGTPPANTKVGQKCSGSSCKQAGYNKKTHKFDGSFFGQ